MNLKEVTQSELMAHPAMRQVVKDIEETRAAKETQRMLDEGERKRLRAEAGRIAQESLNDELARYEQMRVTMHAQVGRVWEAAQAYSRLTGQSSGVFAEQTFMNINLPKLTGSQWDSGFPTTRIAVMAYMSSNKKIWTCE